ncbi:Golgi-associated plant pathogenesis-related protein 1 [Drosophila biarmipes]|uniref:Golgi-associated plant pathogenesis-related protein 1 n=1 Tax=Drosophila biarmipes TaxID=125945 RepID=UPI0021CC6064|nr:Golgi-associated plant pathogenesis-related protein 1 [Drosophila biarmipes]
MERTMLFKIILLLIALEYNRVLGIGLQTLILEAHNRRRAKYGNQPLTLDDKLSQECKTYAEKLVKEGYGSICDANFVDVCSSTHSILDGGGPIGGRYTQNVCVFHDALPRACVRDWFHYRGYRNNKKYYKFTAMIWNASTHLGVGLARVHDTRFLVVRYVPPGNILAEMEFNVPKRLTHFWDKPEESVDVDDSPHKERTTTDPNSGSRAFSNWILKTYIILKMSSLLGII